MNRLIHTLLLFNSLFLFGQENTFYRKYNLTGMQGGLSMVETHDGGFISTGQHEGNGSFGDCDTYVYRIDECGQLKWMYLYGTSLQEGGKNIEQLANGDFLIVGLSDMGQYGFMLRINDDGDIVWSKKFSAWLLTYSSEDVNGNIAITGISWNGQTFVLKIDSNGNVIWYRDLANFGNNGMFVQHISNGDILVTSVQEGSGAFYAARLTNNGSIIWSNNYGPEWYESDHSAFSNKGLIDEENNAFFVVSPYFDNSSWEEDILVTRLDLSTGELQWAKKMGGSQRDQSRDIVKSKNGYAVLGHTFSYQADVNPSEHIDAPISNKNILLFEFNAEGEVLWSKIYGGEGDEKGIGLRNTNDQGFLISAYTSSPFFGNIDYSFDPLFIRTDSTGKIGCQMKEIDLQSSFVAINVTPSGQSISSDLFIQDYAIERANYIPVDEYICQECISIPEFTSTNTTLCVNDTFHFENTTTVGLKCFQQWLINGETFNGSEDINYHFSEPGIYEVQLISSCSNENNVYSMNVIVTDPCTEVENIPADISLPENQLYVPNSFTNNGDQLNQNFYAVFSNPELISEFEILIYNRWGEVVFSSQNLFEGWDGTSRNIQSLPGIYSWKINYTFRNQKNVKYGRVALIR